MRSASGGYVRVAQRLSEEDTKARELQKVESGSGNPDSYNKTDKLNDGSIIKTTRLAIVTTHCRGKSMLKAWFRSNLDAQPLEPPPPRQWPFSLTLLFLLPVLLVTFIGCNYWLSPYIQPAPTKNSNDDIETLLWNYGFLTSKTHFGKTLIPTQWQQMHSSTGPDVYKLERAIQVFNSTCISKLSIKTHEMPLPTSTNKAAANMTTFDSEACPSYFSWIRKDLDPWKESGISRTTLEKVKRHAAFRAIILNGMLYIDLYRRCFQTRALFTLWGLLLLLEKYKNRVPDVEFMFNCGDRPRARRANNQPAIPLFSYCSNHEFYDIPWPDWSFFGWSELEMESWDQEFDKIVKGSKKREWRQKLEKAYWRGNPYVRHAPYREQLLFCYNKTARPIEDPKVDIAIQDWKAELAIGKQNSKLENQCTHRYMIYVEGVSWSVSLKYIMACGSPTMVVSPNHYDFYMRGLQPGVHYIRVQPDNSCVSKLCPKLKEEVELAEIDIVKAEEIGKEGQVFIGKEVGMDKVYDYMFYMLQEYAKLQDFKPRLSGSAHLVTQEYILCLAQPSQRLLLNQAKKLMPSTIAPCYMSQSPNGPPDYGWEAFKHVNKRC